MARSTAFWLATVAASLSAIPLAYAESAPRVLGLQFEKHDVAKTALTASGLQRRAKMVDATIANAQGDLLYLVNVTAGSPPQPMALQLDTGSSDIWLPYVASTACAVKKRCVNGAYDPNASNTYNLLLPGVFDIEYVDGTKITGDYFSDNFSINGSVVANMTQGLARHSSGDDGGIFQGIIGVGFQSGEAIASQTGKTYPNILSVLKKQGFISTQAYSLWLNDIDASTGTILFGGIDQAKYHGDLSILAIQPDADSGTITSFTVTFDNLAVTGDQNSTQYSKTNLATPVILDSGTTLTYLPDQIANDIVYGVGGVNSKTYGIMVPCDLMYTPATFRFGFGNPHGPVIVAPISEFVLPFPAGTKAPKFKDSKKAACRWGILPSGNSPNLFGDTFLRSAYVVYNLDGNQIGIAQTNYNATGSDVKEITATSAIPNAATTVSEVAVSQTVTNIAQQTAGNPLYVTATASSTETLASQPTATFNLGKPTATYSAGAVAFVPRPGTSVVAALLAVLAAFF